EATESQFNKRSPGILTSIIVPALGSVFRLQAQSEALHRSATVLVAATKKRLEGGSLPATLEELVPRQMPAVPLDPFTDDKPLHLRKTAAFWMVYSVGPDGEDDGGPTAPGAEKVEGNDDVGLRMDL
ncbi:MAG: hypothetical protein WCJ18_11855, partial [Planctomycetota bacterium]